MAFDTTSSQQLSMRKSLTQRAAEQFCLQGNKGVINPNTFKTLQRGEGVPCTVSQISRRDSREVIMGLFC